MKHKVMHEGPTGWCEWISPTMNAYQLACCDCGLVHTLQFKVLQVTSRSGGIWRGNRVSGHKVLFRAKRDKRATAQVRRWRPKR